MSYSLSFRKMKAENKGGKNMQTDFEVMGGTYTQVGDYLLPDVEVPEGPQIGVWGERRCKYLQEHDKSTCAAMLLNDTLNAHLEEVDKEVSP